MSYVNKKLIHRLIRGRILIRINTLVVTIMLVAVITITLGTGAYGDVEAFTIKGDGFGNNGARFKSFVVCSDGQKHSFGGGSYLQLNATGSGINSYGSAYGQFIIKYYDSRGNVEHESGYFSNGVLSPPLYILHGIETSNTICHSIPKTTFAFSGHCGNNVNINYILYDKKMLSGSTSSPDFIKVSSFFGSKVLCLMD
jgi:hypothetical protein